MGSNKPVVHNIVSWLDENKQHFLPPVCNKEMHGRSQMKCFFVGGPNVRRDYHIEEGPEFFYMVKGDMCLKVMEQNKPRDVHIREGEVFLLPPRIPHSPQRMADTVGLVIERQRLPHEMDGLRYFVQNEEIVTNEILYEKWFHCENLGPQLAAIINEYFSTEQCKTGIPQPGTVFNVDDAPVRVDTVTKLQEPFSLSAWLDEHREALEQRGPQPLFLNDSLASVHVHGAGESSHCLRGAEVFMWCLRGDAEVAVGEQTYHLHPNDSLWVPCDMQFTLKIRDEGVRVLTISMSPPPCE